MQRFVLDATQTHAHSVMQTTDTLHQEQVWCSITNTKQLWQGTVQIHATAQHDIAALSYFMSIQTTGRVILAVYSMRLWLQTVAHARGLSTRQGWSPTRTPLHKRGNYQLHARHTKMHIKCKSASFYPMRFMHKGPESKSHIDLPHWADPGDPLGGSEKFE